jgi:hypothetical protein
MARRWRIVAGLTEPQRHDALGGIPTIGTEGAPDVVGVRDPHVVGVDLVPLRVRPPPFVDLAIPLDLCQPRGVSPQLHRERPIGLLLHPLAQHQHEVAPIHAQGPGRLEGDPLGRVEDVGGSGGQRVVEGVGVIDLTTCQRLEEPVPDVLSRDLPAEVIGKLLIFERPEQPQAVAVW